MLICCSSQPFTARQKNDSLEITVMILSFRTDMPGQTVQTLEEQSNQGLHCLPFRLHHLDSLHYGSRAT